MKHTLPLYLLRLSLTGKFKRARNYEFNAALFGNAKADPRMVIRVN